MKTSHLFAVLLAVLVSISFPDRARGDAFGSGANSFVIDFTVIGNPGNAPDSASNPPATGSVAVNYRIGTYEISEQMIGKANTLGGLGVFIDARGPDRAATGANWYEAARFVNWLNTSKGFTPAYKFAVQPGEAGYDPNTPNELWTMSDAGFNPNNLYRNSLARYFLPSFDEWYKAAYYDPIAGVYHEYATGSDTAPTPVASGTAAGSAVYEIVTLTGPADITQAGGLSPYGTMGQGGNVQEYQETDVDLVNGPLGTGNRGLRGGNWSNGAISLSRINFASANPTINSNGRGFRVAASAVPGDYNGNGIVDAADYVLWRKGGPLQNEVDTPGSVNAADYTVWRQRFGNPNPGSGTSLGGIAIPEPSTILPCVVVFAALSSHRRKSNSRHTFGTLVR